ncbi:MAG: RNA-binding S4 domain-containing protein [Helicobacteraceae bacterium]|jgi:ribosomal 50S subunit-recycling heat shock protein|nr:RNA-binding S4 domain-containing protein [Helicobacteraceae bacterium]
MRIDSFLNAANLVKRRAIAQDMIAHEAVLLNDKPTKNSHEVKVGDKIELRYLAKSLRFVVLAVPNTRTVPKSAREVYVKEIQ